MGRREGGMEGGGGRRRSMRTHTDARTVTVNERIGGEREGGRGRGKRVLVSTTAHGEARDGGEELTAGREASSGPAAGAR